MGSQRKFQTGDAKAFKKAIDMTDDELAAIAAGDPPDAGCDDDTFIEVEADFQPITLRRLVAT
jgi:hypothetical protein